MTTDARPRIGSADNCPPCGLGCNVLAGLPGTEHNERVKESVPPMAVSHASHGVPHQSADAEQLLSGLDPEQREVALALRGPVRVLAGAGTGKTRAITHRIAYGVASGGYAPTQGPAGTLTHPAPREMRARLGGLRAGSVPARALPSPAPRPPCHF